MKGQISCPHCGQVHEINYDKTHLGQDAKIKCNNCGKLFKMHIPHKSGNGVKTFIYTIVIIGMIILYVYFRMGSSFSGVPNETSTEYNSPKNEESIKINTATKSENLEDIKKTIVWVKYEFDGKNADGSYFSQYASGSGILFYQNGSLLQIITNRHVVDCDYAEPGSCYQRLGDKITVRTYDGQLHNVKKVMFAPKGLDIAVLEIQTNQQYETPNTIRINDISVGEKVIAIGYPSLTKDFTEFKISEGKVTGTGEIISGGGFGFKSINSDAYTYFGSSGGGLFDENGNLIGVNTWGGEGISVAASVSLFDNIDTFGYCTIGYAVGENCIPYCDRNEVLGKDSNCHSPCEDFYCMSRTFNIDDPQCKDKGMIPGEDGYCHQPCESPTTYCMGNAICYRNRCTQCPEVNTALYEDGTCRLYE